MKFFKKIWTTIKIFFVGKKKKSDIKVYQDAKATIEKGIDKEEILTKASNATNDEERKEILKPLIEFESAKQIVEVIEQEPEILSEQKTTKKRKKLYDLHELENEIKILQSTLSLLDLKQSSIKEVANPDTSSFDSRIDKLFSLLSKNKIDDKVELSDFTVSAFDKDFKQLEKLLQEKSTLKRHGNREREKQKQREIYESNIKKELNNLDSLIGQNKLAEAKTLINLLSNSIKPNLQKELARLTKAKEKYKEKELYNFKKQEEELLKQQAEEVRIIKQLQEQKKNEEALEKKKLIESQTDYSIQLQFDKNDFSCSTILKHRKQNNLHDNLERGVALLNGDKELKQYIHSFGNMHIAKLKSAFQVLITPNNFSHSTEQIEIFDWGCGQGLGSIALIDQLKIHKNKNELIEKITLIEPGTDALKRATLHASLALNSESKINSINKYIDRALNDKDLINKKHSFKIHIFSNIIDINEVDADLINELITSQMSGVNYIVCVGPRFGDSKDRKMEYFANSFKYCNDFKIISNREDGQGWNHHKTWTRKEIILKINL